MHLVIMFAILLACFAIFPDAFKFFAKIALAAGALWALGFGYLVFFGN